MPGMDFLSAKSHAILSDFDVISAHFEVMLKLGIHYRIYIGFYLNVLIFQ